MFSYLAFTGLGSASVFLVMQPPSRAKRKIRNEIKEEERKSSTKLVARGAIGALFNV